MFADDEIELAVRQALDARRATVVLDFLDLTGHGHRSYVDTARRYGISRERVRQILKVSRAKVGPCAPALEHVRRAVSFFLCSVPAPVAYAAEQLRAAGLLSPSGSVAGLLRAAKWLGLAECPKLVTPSPSGAAVLDRDGRGSCAKRIITAARSATAGVGVAELSTVIDGLDRHGVTAHRRSVLALLEVEPEFHWIGDDWFWFGDMRNRLANYSLKALAVARVLEPGELRAALATHPRLRSGLPPARVLLSFYSQHPAFSVVEGRVREAQERDAESLLGSAQRKLYRVLRDNGPSLSRSEFRRLALDAGVNSSTFYVYVNRVPFVRATRSGYELLGPCCHARDGASPRGG